MSRPGDADILVAARSALLDALEALADQRAAVVLIGAQAIYLHTSGSPVALAEATKDSDLAVDPRILNDDPRLEEAMQRAGFRPSPIDPQPGSWISPRGIPVDLMVPARMSGDGGRRGGRIPPHGRRATRRATGLEAALIDNAPMIIKSLDPSDTRAAEIAVAGPAALAATLSELLDSELAGSSVSEATVYLQQLFASGPDALGAMMAGRAEELIGNAPVVSAAVATLAADLMRALPRQR